MTDHTNNTSPQRPSDETQAGTRNYVIRHGGAFYRPNAQGYTYSIHEAGRWTKDEAAKHINNDPLHTVTVHHEREFVASGSCATASEASEVNSNIGELIERTPLIIEALRSYDQADEEGVMVLASRQACDESADALTALHNQIETLKKERDEAQGYAKGMEECWRSAKRRSFDAHLRAESLETGLTAEKEKCARLEAGNAKKDAALEPFAKAAEAMDPDLSEKWPVMSVWKDIEQRNPHVTLTYGDFRRARTALSNEGGEK